MVLKNKLIILIALVAILLINVPAVSADCTNKDGTLVTGPKWLIDLNIDDGLLIPCNCVKSNCSAGQCDDSQCDFTDIVQAIVNFSKLILGVVGSLALLMFMWGGIQFIISQGNEQKIEEAKNTLKNAAIGIFIVFTAWVIVNFIIIALSGTADIDINFIQGLLGL